MSLTTDDRRRFAESHEAGQYAHCVEILHRGLEDDLYRFFRKRLHSDDLAQDLAQRTWLVVAKEVAKVKRPSRVTAWFWKVARSVKAGHLRGMSRERRLSGELVQQASTNPSGESDNLFAAVPREELDRVIDTLPFNVQLIVRNKYFKGKKFTEIAEFMDWSPDRVRKVAQRARETIRELIGVRDDHTT